MLVVSRFRVWKQVVGAGKLFLQIDGASSAAAFAYFAFFALFPLILLFVTLASFLINKDRAGSAVITLVENYVPISGSLQRNIFETLSGVVEARGTASIVAILLLVWGAQQFFNTLICATNRAWGEPVSTGWRLPLKSVAFLGAMTSAILLGIALPVLEKTINDLLPVLVVFLSMSVFYRHAPRTPKPLAHVWGPALCATVLLQIVDRLFMSYLQNIVRVNIAYGAFAGIMALLLWIYLFGMIVIFGACLCATALPDHVGNIYRTIAKSDDRR